MGEAEYIKKKSEEKQMVNKKKELEKQYRMGRSFSKWGFGPKNCRPIGFSGTLQTSVIVCADVNFETLEWTWGEETLKLTEIYMVDLEA